MHNLTRENESANYHKSGQCWKDFFLYYLNNPTSEGLSVVSQHHIYIETGHTS